MEINVVDIGSKWIGRVVLTLRSLNQEVIEMQGGPGGVARMVDEVIKKVGSPRNLQVLRIYAHGGPGVINVAGGEFDESEALSAISVSNLPKIEPTLRLLTPYFVPDGRVELLGCDVALDKNKKISEKSPGLTLLSKLAKIWNVEVLASGNPKQLPIASIKFVGLVVRVAPFGGLTCTNPPEVTRVKAANQ